jgi:hypothetical protein
MVRFLRPDLMTRTVCTLLAALLLLGSAPARSGPLPVRDHFLLGVGFLAFEPTAADVLPSGSWQLDAVWSLANTWAISPQIDLALQARPGHEPVTLEQLEALAKLSSDGGSIFIDGEVSRLLVAIRRGVGRKLQVELRVPLLDFGGGVLDAPVESFHELVGLAQDGRGGATTDRFLISSTTRRGDLLVQESPAPGIGDIVVGAKLRLSGSASSATRTALETLVKLPAGGSEPIVSSGSIDVGLELLAAHDFRRWSIHGAAGVLFLGASDRLGIDSQRRYSLLGAVELVAGPRSRLVLQLDASESPFQSFATARIGEPASHVTLGWKRAVGRRNQLFVAMTDNIQNFTNAADLDLHFGITRTLSR